MYRYNADKFQCLISAIICFLFSSRFTFCVTILQALELFGWKQWASNIYHARQSPAEPWRQFEFRFRDGKWKQCGSAVHAESSLRRAALDWWARAVHSGRPARRCGRADLRARRRQRSARVPGWWQWRWVERAPGHFGRPSGRVPPHAERVGARDPSALPAAAVSIGTCSSTSKLGECERTRTAPDWGGSASSRTRAIRSARSARTPPPVLTRQVSSNANSCVVFRAAIELEVINWILLSLGVRGCWCTSLFHWDKI